MFAYPLPVDAAEIDTEVSVCSKAEADVLRLYIAMFNREYDFGGGTYWVGQYRDGKSLEEIAYWMSQGPEHKAKYRSFQSDDAYIERVYRNVFKRSPDIIGKHYWLTEMKLGLKRHETIRWMAQSPELINRYDYIFNSQCPEPPPELTATTTTTIAPTTTAATAGVYYENCTAVWNAIGRPIYPSDPGFRDDHDGDSDGVGCESRPR